MADDDFIEDFNITESDLDSAFNPTRRRGRQSKEEAIYGIWATASERATNRSTTTTTSSAYYSRVSQPVAFVSGGFKSGSNVEKNKPSTKVTKKKSILPEDYISDEDSDEKLDDEDDDDDEVEVIGKKRKKRGDMSDDDDDDDSDNDSDVEEIQDESNQRVGSSDEEAERPTIQRQPPNVNYRRPPPMNSAPVRDKDFGAFEKHTKGIGMKLLTKMGYKQGHGLGKNLQGRALPIQVQKRQGKGAIGRYGHEDPNRVIPTDESEPASSSKSSKKNATPNVPQWRKQQREKVPKQQYIYKTMDDVLKEQSTKFQNKKAGEQTREKIIDMTGREQRVLQNYDSISTKHLDQEQLFSVEELTHNLDMIIESCEEEMIRSDRRRKFDEDVTVALQYDLSHTQKLISDDEIKINRLNILLNMIDRCEQCVQQITNVNDLFFLQRVFEELKRNYSKEYQTYRLWDIAVPVLHNQFKQHLTVNWNILHGEHEHDQEIIDMFAKWKDTLEDDTIDLTTDNSIPSKENMDPYHRLIWEVWMPFVRRAVLDWNSRHPDELIDMIERWKSILPRWILDNILDQLVLPVLHREVDAWNPLTDSVPIHSWIHPWLPLMKERLEPLYQPIRTKLGQALQNWQPSDSSAKAVLLPWQKVFPQTTWDAYMNKHIVPKLVTLMQQFIIDPRQQVLDPWNWFISWIDMVPLSSMIAILEKTFFPKWLQVLNTWLNTNPNYQEIQRWYSGWRSLLPPAFINHTIIKEKLTEGLMMIDRRISGPVNIQPTPPPPPAPAANVNYEALFNRGIASSTSTVVSSFKDLVEKKAAEQNVLFIPITNRTFEGKQVYQFGKTNIYIDKNVIFIFDNGQWFPVRLNDLIRRAV